MLRNCLFWNFITITECEVLDVTSAGHGNQTHPDAMGRYLKLIDPVNGKVAYQKRSGNANHFLFWRNRDGWMVKQFYKSYFYNIANKTYILAHIYKSFAYFDIYTISQGEWSNPWWQIFAEISNLLEHELYRWIKSNKCYLQSLLEIPGYQ